MYRVLGYGEGTELFDSASLSECQDFVSKYTRFDPTWGGYEVITIEAESGQLQIQYIRDDN